MMKNPVASIGKVAIELFTHTYKILTLLVQTVYWIVAGPFKRKFVKSEHIFSQMVFVGAKSILIVFVVSFFTGIVIAMQSAYQLARLGAVVYVAALVSVSMARELGPVLTSLVIAGRVGSAIAAELGTMKVTEQIEALKTIALNPVRFLVVPRFLALLVMVPCLTIFAVLCGIYGGFLVGVYNLHINPHLYWSTTFKFLVTKDVLTGLYKSIVFGVIIAVVGCYQGLNTKGGAEGVGKATTVSVVTSFILIILVDCIMTAIFYFSNM